MKRVLIISPHFPPANFPDMHRVRQSLPYLSDLGWDATVLAVDPNLVEGSRDDDLLLTVPSDVTVEHVGAMDPGRTRRLGLGSLALRSLGSFRRAGNRLLSTDRFDLVYFSTTQFPVLVLGRYWKRRFGVPYVVDMQDPWRSDHYLQRPRAERPPKFWLSYALDALLEQVAMRRVDGLISVSQGYCDVLQARYRNITPEMCRVIPFGGPQADFAVLDEVLPANPFFSSDSGHVHAVYVGRGGHDMARAARGIFGGLAEGLREQPALFDRVRLHFIGTDYAPEGFGKETLKPLAADFGVADRVSEYPSRVPYFTALQLLREADMAVLPGSDDPAYTASKIYPYILARRPLLAVFNEGSSVVDVLRATRAGQVITFQSEEPDDHALHHRVRRSWSEILERLPAVPDTDWAAFEPYTARAMTARQVEVFDRVVAATSEESSVPGR